MLFVSERLVVPESVRAPRLVGSVAKLLTRSIPAAVVKAVVEPVTIALLVIRTTWLGTAPTPVCTFPVILARSDKLTVLAVVELDTSAGPGVPLVRDQPVRFESTSMLAAPCTITPAAGPVPPNALGGTNVSDELPGGCHDSRNA